MIGAAKLVGPIALLRTHRMAGRREVVELVHRYAFDATAKPSIPDDAAPEELAEGLVLRAVEILIDGLGKQKASQVAHALVEKYLDK
jgi:hypothetical protein